MLLSVAGLAAAVPAALAQGQGGGGRGRGGGGMIERQLGMMKERLDLSAEQEEKVKAILEEQVQKMREMRQKGGGDREAMFEQMGKLREETNKKMGEVLSKEQMEEYSKMQEEMRGRMGGRGGRGGQGRERQQQQQQ